MKILIPTPPSFSACAHFWCFNLQQLVLKICSNYFKFSATLFNLQQLYVFFFCSNVFSFAASLFYLQQLFNLQHVPCGLPYVSYLFVFRSKWMRGWLGQVSCQCLLLEYGWILQLQMRRRIYTKRTRTLCRWKWKNRMPAVLCIFKENGEVFQRVRNFELIF